ncbi:MAG: Gfo/Idh/MocA family oxidoreductase [Planctomycetes bacterium]|nr:Gfo/Idh/MocA family oxidoreductase [Planctomycetota bacterium]
MSTPIRWGILGTGSIAKQFARGLAAIAQDATLVAVGSRTAASADAFAKEFGAKRAHATYEALARDAEVDAIYIATPHPMHRDNALLCIDAGKAVLCEKPFTVNAAEAEEVIARARAKGVFLMEAMWTRFLPAIAQTRQWIAEGAIGEPRMVTADFGFRAGFDPKSRLFAPALAGGALLDVGVYTIALASMVFGPQPTAISAHAHLGESGVDEQTAVTLAYAGGRLASLTCAVRTNTPQAARIDGTEGSIEIPGFWHTQKAILHAGGKDTVAEKPFIGNGYSHQAIEVAACLRAKRTESAVIPWSESIAIMRIMDDVRRHIGLRYPFENAAKAQGK